MIIKKRKYMHPSSNVVDIREEIEEYGYIVSNIWNIKKQSISYVLCRVKSENNNKDIYEIRSLFQYKIKFESL